MKPATASELHDQAEAIATSTAIMSVEPLALLRQPFPASQVGVLPQPYKKDSPKGHCGECGKWHGLPAMHLDFVGHGAVTQRLLDVDPEWTWEPFALDASGLPALDRHGNLWIRLTVCGVTRIGVGDGATMKVLIGDAIRNAAMRFGVALDLWVHGSEDEKQDGNETLPEPAPVWDQNMTKFEVKRLLGGDKEAARQAWEYASGDALTEFGPEVAKRIADAWQGRTFEAGEAPAGDTGEGQAAVVAPDVPSSVTSPASPSEGDA